MELVERRRGDQETWLRDRIAFHNAMRKVWRRLRGEVWDKRLCCRHCGKVGGH